MFRRNKKQRLCKFWAANKVSYGRCANGESKGVIKERSRYVTLPWEQIFGPANMADKNKRNGHA